MPKNIEHVYCEGNVLDGQYRTVNKGTQYFNVKIENQDFGNGPQDVIIHYKRTSRLKNTTEGDFVVFYSSPDWDR